MSTSNHKMSTSNHICEKCNKNYEDRSGLWRHKQKCNFIDEEAKIDENVDLNDKNLILTLIQQNNELQKQLLEVIKNGT